MPIWLPADEDEDEFDEVAVPAAEDDNEDEWVLVAAVAVVAVVFPLDLLLSGEAEWLAANLPTIATVWPTTRSFSLLLATTVIL